MQNTLLGIGIALILALLAALVGPYFVNWNTHRAFFEAEATRLVGLPVHVSGAIDARLLPTPSITLRGIALGAPGEASRLRAGALSFQLGLGPLMRGEIKAVEMRLIGPEVKFGLNADGTLDWPKMAMGISSETLSIERLTIDEGRAILTDASTGARLVLDKLKFRGEVRSLVGPVRGEGSFAIGDGVFRYRVSTGRMVDDAMRLRLILDLVDRPLTIDADGGLSSDYGAPRFEGNLTLSRPLGAAIAGGRAMVNEPWRATSKIKATPTAAMFDQIEFNYGPDERAMKFTGTAELKLGEQPRLQGLFSARQIDLDRLAAKTNAARLLPFAAAKKFAEMFGGSVKPLMPTRFGFSIDAVTLGGATLQAVTGDLSTQGDTWNLDKLELRAPGFTQVRATGRLALSEHGLGFAGFASVNATDSMTLMAWLTGRPNPTPGPLKPWQAQGDVTLSSGGIAVEQLRTVFDRATVEGRLAYAASDGGRPASLKAELGASDIDIDAWMQVGETILAHFALEPPEEIDLALEIAKGRVAGIETRKATLNFKLDGNGLDLKRLSVEALGDASFDASGRILTRSASPSGEIKVELNARDLSGVIALAGKFAPAIADPLRRLAGRDAAGRLHATIGVESSAANAPIRRTTARVGLQGQIGGFKLQIAGASTARTETISFHDLSGLLAGELRFEGQMDADDSGALLVLLGLDRIAVAETRPGRLKVIANGTLNRDVRVSARLIAGPFDVNGIGSARLPDDRPLHVNFGQFLGTVGGSKVQGKINVSFGAPVRVEGTVEADRLDVPAALASVIGLPVERLTTGDPGAETWSAEPFPLVGTGIAGRLDMKAARATVTAGLAAERLRGVLQFASSKVSFEVLEGQIAGGRLTGDVAFFSSPDGMSALSYFELAGAKASELFPATDRPPIRGTLSMKATVEGAGLTPAAFMGSLHGNGEIAIEHGEFAGLNPNVFDALTRAVDLGVKADTKQIREFVTLLLENGHLTVRRAHSRIAFVGGELRLVEPRVEAAGAELAVAGSVDLANATVDATLKLSGAPEGDVAGRPAVTVALKGPVAAPKHSVNTDSLAAWLALRSVEQQSKRLETIEAARRAAMATPLVELPALMFAPAAPQIRAGEEDEAKSPAAQSANGPAAQSGNGSAAQPTESSIGIVADQIPPLPPPIMIKPAVKPQDQSAPRRANRR